MVKYDKGKHNVSYERISAYHWHLINPKTKKGKYNKRNSLIGRIETAKAKYEIDREFHKVKFLNFLTNNSYKNLYELIISPAPRLNKIQKKLTRILRKYKLLNNTKFYSEMLNTIFSYKSWRASNSFQKIFNLMNIPVCPYCNLDELYPYKDVHRNFIVTSLDHYYDKAKFPYFSLTFSNLIPVCQKCNETFKGERTFTSKTHLHPYVDSYNRHCKFTNLIVLDKQGDIEIEYLNLDNKPRRINNDLGLLNRYNTLNNKREAKDIYYMHQEYPESRKEELMDLLQCDTLEEFEKEFCRRRSIPFEQDEIRMNQKGKLKRDLAIQYQLLTVRD